MQESPGQQKGDLAGLYLPGGHPYKNQRKSVELSGGFSWGYTENIRNEVSLLDFRLLSETDWNMQKTLISSDTGGEDK